MAPTKHNLETTEVWEEVLDLVIPYIHNLEDRNSVSLVSRKSHEIDGITRKRLTAHTLYYPNPASLSNRFPFIQSLTLKGPPSDFDVTHDYDIQLCPWIEQLALKFRCLKELHICGLVVCDEDLETLARTRGKDLRSVKISKCKGFSTDGLRHVSNYCNQLRTLCLKYPTNSFKYCDYIQVKDDIWIHQLALNNTVLERLHVKNIDFSNNAQELMLLAKNCCNSLKSLKIRECYLSKLGDAFKYAVRLEHFSGENLDEEFDLVGLQLPPHMRSLRIECLPPTRYSIVLPCLNQIRKLELVHFSVAYMCQCSLFKMCPNVEVLYPADECGDTGVQVIGKFCKKLRKLTHSGLMTHVGLMALAKGCPKLEFLEVRLRNISNEALKCLGTHLKNLRKLRVTLYYKDGAIDPPLDNGIRAMLMGCRKLESLDIGLCHDGLTDVGLDYIGKYGANLKSLSLTHVRISNEGLVKLSEGCPRLRKLKLRDCPFRELAVASIVFNMPSLRYVWFDSCDRTPLALTRPEFQL